jgi:nitrogen fixation protein FixH
MQADASKPHEFTGRHMLAIMLTFFAVIAGVNLAMAYLANSTWSGLVVSNGYVASQSFNADEARAKTQEALGWKVGLTHDPAGLAFSFAGRNAEPLGGLAVTGQLRRPATERDDLRLAFHEGRRGTYTAAATLASGVWDIEIDAATYRKTFRFVVK